MNTLHENEGGSWEALRSQKRITLKQLDGVSNPQSIHGIYPYRGKMSALDAANVISQLPADRALLDPFCGSGTIVYEAQLHGMNSIGVDSNPLACTIARGKTEALDTKETMRRIIGSIEEAKDTTDNYIMPNSASKYFHPHTANEIMNMHELSENFSAFELSVFYGSICLAARACNRWTWTSTSVGKINQSLRRVDFYATLLRKARKHIEFVRGEPKVKIHNHDARRIQEVIPKASIDVVYTSPPYFDALDYTGYYTKIVLDIIGVDRTGIRKELIQNYSTYQNDMTIALNAIDKVIHDKALVIFVVGDRMVRRKLVKGAEFFSDIAPWKSPYIVERSYTGTASGIWDKINKTQRKEQVLIWDLSSGGRIE
ncbi:MAG: DNA adenine methylase [Candidatus Thorarchaeota archaeon]|jgi:site-specific DNA-methyltransferase (cytosine-N4-specific)